MLSSRNSKIIKAILLKPNIKSSELETNLGLTRRQISYSINSVNELLAEESLPAIVRIHRGNFVVESKTVEYLRSQVLPNQHKSTQPVEYSYRSEQQRIYVITLIMLIVSEEVSLISIYDYLKVSKTTAISDLHKVKSLMNSYQLSLHYSRKVGYVVKGNEKNIRVLLNDITEKLITNTQGMIDIENLSNIKIEPVIHFVHQIEQELEITYSDDAFQYITRIMQVTLSRDNSNKNEQPDFFKHQVTDSIEYKLIKEALPTWWYTNQSSTEWLALIFLTGNTLHNNSHNQDPRLSAAIHEMVTEFERQTLVFIQNRHEFEARLYRHLRPAFFRVKYGLLMKDIGIEHVVNHDSKHHLLVKTIEKIIAPIEQLAKKKFPKNEVELISFYFGSELQNEDQKIDRKQRAAVVCNNGLIVAQIMYEALRQLFPEISFLSATSVREFQSYQRDYDLVFTTVPLKTSITQFIVSPFMNIEEKSQLRHRVLREIGSVDERLNQILKIISASADIKQPKVLQGELRQYLLHQSTGDLTDVSVIEGDLPSLIAYVDPDRISVHRDVESWRQALNQAGILLQNDHKVSRKYIDTVMQVTASPKNYSFLGLETAIPHASPEDGVLADGFSLVVVQNGVDFPGHPGIKLIVMLAIKDTSKHLRAIKQLNELIMNQVTFNELLSCNDSNSLYKVIENLIDGS